MALKIFTGSSLDIAADLRGMDKNEHRLQFLSCCSPLPVLTLNRRFHSLKARIVKIYQKHRFLSIPV